MYYQEYPGYVAYTTPLFFRDDWLNLYLDSYNMHVDPNTFQEKNEVNGSDYRFVYMGLKGQSRDIDVYTLLGTHNEFAKEN